MKSRPAPGDRHSFAFTVTEAKTVPRLYPESPEFSAMPEVFATGYMVGLLEWACMDALSPHLEEGEGSLGIGMDVTHSAATLPGQTVTVSAECVESDGNRLGWRVTAHDGIDTIGEGIHRRAVVRWDGFNARMEEKRRKIRDAARAAGPLPPDAG